MPSKEHKHLDPTEMKFVSGKEYRDAVDDKDQIASELGVRKQFIPDQIRIVKKKKDDKEDKDRDDYEEKRLLEFTITTSSTDREGDVIESEGFETENFEKNPVVLFSHQWSRPPIGRATRLDKEKKRIVAEAEFMTNEIDTSGFSDMIYRMLIGGFLRATSVGFYPKEFEWIKEDKRDEDGEKYTIITGLKFTKQELLEFSVVPIPANPEALMGAKTLGIDISPLEGWFEEALDQWSEYKGMLLVPRETVETMRKTAKEVVGKGVSVAVTDERGGDEEVKNTPASDATTVVITDDEVKVDPVTDDKDTTEKSLQDDKSGDKNVVESETSDDVDAETVEAVKRTHAFIRKLLEHDDKDIAREAKEILESETGWAHSSAKHPDLDEKSVPDDKEVVDVYSYEMEVGDYKIRLTAPTLADLKDLVEWEESRIDEISDGEDDDHESPDETKSATGDDGEGDDKGFVIDLDDEDDEEGGEAQMRQLLKDVSEILPELVKDALQKEVGKVRGKLN